MSSWAQEELRETAKEAAELRRGAELGDLPTEPGRSGVFAWLHDGPRSGQRATLAYNKAASSLRCVCMSCVDDERWRG